MTETQEKEMFVRQRRNEILYGIHQEVAKIMGEVWRERPWKNLPLSRQVRDMAHWKPRWTHDERPLTDEEVANLHGLADLAEKHEQHTTC